MIAATHNNSDAGESSTRCCIGRGGARGIETIMEGHLLSFGLGLLVGSKMTAPIRLDINNNNGVRDEIMFGPLIISKSK